ncbi:unnamed protein product [Ixodes pacificus]
MARMAASMNFPPVSDARKGTEKKVAADAQRQEEAAQEAAEAAVFDDQSKCFQLLELVQNYPWLYGKLRRDDKDNHKTGERLEGGRPSVGHRALRHLKEKVEVPEGQVRQGGGQGGRNRAQGLWNLGPKADLLWQLALPDCEATVSRKYTFHISHSYATTRSFLSIMQV